MAARCAAGAATGCTCPRNASPSSSCSTTCRTPTTPRWICSPPCWARTGRRAPPQHPDAGLARRLHRAGDRTCGAHRRSTDGQVRLRYGHFPDLLDLQADGTARDPPALRLRPGDGGLWMDRPFENQSSRLRPCDGAPARDVAGRYRCEELDAELTVVDAGGVLYGGFSGFLGQGRMELLGPVGARCLGAALSACAGPHAARRLDAGLPPRRIGPGRRRRGRLLAGPPPELRAHRLT